MLAVPPPEKNPSTIQKKWGGSVDGETNHAYLPNSARTPLPSLYQFPFLFLFSHFGAPSAYTSMTARAFLGLSDGLREAFAKAQDDETLRYLQVKIVNEDTLSTVGSKQRGGDLATDFDDLAQVRRHPAGYSGNIHRSVSPRDRNHHASMKDILLICCLRSSKQQVILQPRTAKIPPRRASVCT